MLGSRAFGSVRRTAAEPSRYGRVGVITELGQLPLFANFATFGSYPSAGREGGGEREVERKQTPPPTAIIPSGGQPRHFLALLYAQSQASWSRSRLPSEGGGGGGGAGGPPFPGARSKCLGSHPESLGGTAPPQSPAAPFPRFPDQRGKLLSAL